MLNFLSDFSSIYSDTLHSMFEDLTSSDANKANTAQNFLDVSKYIIKGSDFSDNYDLSGANKKVTIYTYDGHDYIETGDNGSVIYNGSNQKDITLGKGDDTVYLGSGLTNIAYYNNSYATSGGKDIIYNNENGNLYLSLENSNFKNDNADLCLYITDAKAKFDFEKSNNDLIMTIIHDKSKQTVTIRNCFAGYEQAGLEEVGNLINLNIKYNKRS